MTTYAVLGVPKTYTMRVIGLVRIWTFILTIATIATVQDIVAGAVTRDRAAKLQQLRESYRVEQQQQQKPLSVISDADITVAAQRHQPHWRIYPQDDRTCTANTTRHFTGRVPVTDERELFFWFAESRRDPLADPTILWLNGGPAGSSMSGFFQEIGPCVLIDNDGINGTTNATVIVVNPDSWVNFANVLVLDQPAGTGFSTAAGNSAPISLAEATVDFSVFVGEFVERFPAYFTHGFYVAGESFGGRFVPRYVSDIISRQQQLRGEEEDDALPVRIDGIILVDAFIDGVSPFIGHHELFCTDEYQDILRFNATACESIGKAIPRAEYLLSVCQDTQDPVDCGEVTQYVMSNIYVFLEEAEATGNYTRYDCTSCLMLLIRILLLSIFLRNDRVSANSSGMSTVREPCELKDMFCIPPMQLFPEPHLNRPDIQKLLGFDAPREYRSVNFSLNEIWSQQPEITIPTTRNVSWLLDEGDIRILAFSGVYDAATYVDIALLVFSVTHTHTHTHTYTHKHTPFAANCKAIANKAQYRATPGMFREFDQLPWSENDEFRKQPKTDWFWTDSNGSLVKGGKIKGVQKLQVASVYDAGHMSPGDAKPAVASLVRQWID